MFSKLFILAACSAVVFGDVGESVDAYEGKSAAELEAALTAHYAEYEAKFSRHDELNDCDPYNGTVVSVIIDAHRFYEENVLCDSCGDAIASVRAYMLDHSAVDTATDPSTRCTTSTSTTTTTTTTTTSAPPPVFFCGTDETGESPSTDGVDYCSNNEKCPCGGCCFCGCDTCQVEGNCAPFDAALSRSKGDRGRRDAAQCALDCTAAAAACATNEAKNGVATSYCATTAISCAAICNDPKAAAAAADAKAAAACHDKADADERDAFCAEMKKTEAHLKTAIEEANGCTTFKYFEASTQWQPDCGGTSAGVTVTVTVPMAAVVLAASVAVML